MKFNNNNLDYWKMSNMSISDSLNIVEMGCSSRDCHDCDCQNDDDDEDDDCYEGECYVDEYGDPTIDVNDDWFDD